MWVGVGVGEGVGEGGGGKSEELARQTTGAQGNEAVACKVMLEKHKQTPDLG